MAVDFTQEIRDLRATMASVREVTDLGTLQRRIAELEQQASDPALWEDQERAQQVTSGLSRAKAEHDRVTGMDARIDDLEAHAESYDLGNKKDLKSEFSDLETEDAVAKELRELKSKRAAQKRGSGEPA